MRIYEVTRAEIGDDPDEIGAWVRTTGRNSEPTVLLPINKLDILEPDVKFQDPVHKANLLNIVKALRKGAVLPPIVVRRVARGRFQVVDGHHRLMAHKILNRREIAAKILKPFNVKIAGRARPSI